MKRKEFSKRDTEKAEGEEEEGTGDEEEEEEQDIEKEKGQIAPVVDLVEKGEVAGDIMEEGEVVGDLLEEGEVVGDLLEVGQGGGQGGEDEIRHQPWKLTQSTAITLTGFFPDNPNGIKHSLLILVVRQFLVPGHAELRYPPSVWRDNYDAYIAAEPEPTPTFSLDGYPLPCSFFSRNSCWEGRDQPCNKLAFLINQPMKLPVRWTM